MTQFNLLPDIKLAYLRAEKTKRIVYSISVLVTMIAVLAVSGFFVITAIQGKALNDLKANIKSQGLALSKHKNLQEILTIQQQISTLDVLHQQEPQVTNLATYLNQLIPVTASINSLTGDFNAHTMTLTGTANNLATINQLIDSIKFATYTIKGQSGSTAAFSSVNLTSFGIAPQGTNYSIDFNFNPELFDSTHQISLKVPSKYTTRSELDQPISLFKPSISNPKVKG